MRRLVVLMLSCSNVDKRVELLEESLQLNVGDNFKVMDNSYRNRNGFLEKDFTIILKLKLEKLDLKRMIIEIKSRPFYNKLNEFKNSDD